MVTIKKPQSTWDIYKAIKKYETKTHFIALERKIRKIKERRDLLNNRYIYIFKDLDLIVKEVFAKWKLTLEYNPALLWFAKNLFRIWKCYTDKNKRWTKEDFIREMRILKHRAITYGLKEEWLNYIARRMGIKEFEKIKV